MEKTNKKFIKNNHAVQTHRQILGGRKEGGKVRNRERRAEKKQGGREEDKAEKMREGERGDRRKEGGRDGEGGTEREGGKHQRPGGRGSHGKKTGTQAKKRLKERVSP